MISTSSLVARPACQLCSSPSRAWASRSPPRRPWRGRSGVSGCDAGGRLEHCPFAPEPLRLESQRPNARGARGDRGQVRVPAQSVPARRTDGLCPGLRRDARGDGRIDLAACPYQGRLSGSRAPRLGRDGIQPLRRGRAGDARALALARAPPAALGLPAAPRKGHPVLSLPWRDVREAIQALPSRTNHPPQPPTRASQLRKRPGGNKNKPRGPVSPSFRGRAAVP